MKDPKKVKQGKKNRVSGADFERRVRANLEEYGWIVFKNNNNVVDDNGDKRYKQGKAKYNPFNKSLMMNGQGFPDFLCLKHEVGNGQFRKVMAVECKSNGRLSKEEKEKCEWLLVNNIISRILIAKKVKEGRKIKVEYKDALI
jgi:hypothetical protein